MLKLFKALLAPALLLAALLVAQPAAAANCSGRNADSTLVQLSGQLAATVTSSDQANCTGKGVVVVVDLTTMTTATVTVTIQGKDVASGKYYTLLAGAAKTSTGTTVMLIYPNSPVTTNVSANSPLPATWRVSVVVADNSGTAVVTGTIGASVIQ